jgi:hypothetical protein
VAGLAHHALGADITTPLSEDELIDRSVALAGELVVTARAGTSRRQRRRQLRLRRLLASESGTRLSFSLAVLWVREQVVSRSLHRYGNVVYEPLWQ